MLATEAMTRLNRYDIEAALSDGDVLAATLALGGLAPFTADVDLADPPEALLDWTALKAYALAADELPAITSEGIGDTSGQYATPRYSQTHARMRELAAPYLKRTGARA